VPTPFYHLHLAEELLNHPSIGSEVRRFLNAWRPFFLFGNTAPDVQVVSGQPRQQTHFFNLPIQEGDPAPWELVLSEHPQLANPHGLPAQQSIFLVGYLCHLQADWMWVKEIFAPVFGPKCTWGSFKERLYLHNVLRAYLDMDILPKLQPGLDTCLRQLNPDHFLPFVTDSALIKWRDLLCPQLKEGAASQTVEVFSSRQGIPVPEFQMLLASEDRLQREIFNRISLHEIQGHHQHVLEANVQLLSEYLAFCEREMAYESQADEIKEVRL